MKFLVLALCVCAASAASYGGYKPAQQVASAFAQTVASPFVAAAKTVAAAPVVAAKAVYTAGKDAEAAVLRSDSDVSPDGYNYVYETGNGIYAQASGVTKKVNNEDVVVVQGSYKYVSPEGNPVEFSYVADENGYQPQSDWLPVAPAIPEAIVRSLEYQRTHPAKPEKF